SAGVSQNEVNQSGNTMPGRFFLQSFLRRAVKAQCRYAIIEVTSEGIRQYRDRFIDFDIAAFTNLHPEHIESHGSFENYREAKLDFFRNVRSFSQKHPKWFFVNGEDANAKFFIEASGGQAASYSKADVADYELSPALLGDFNRENVAAAERILKAADVPELVRRRAFKTFAGVPGRMEFIQHEPFAVVVDYAHTPESLGTVYETLSRDLKPRNMICILGSAGGGRDKWKRPKFGGIASEYCSRIILTNEDPFDEDPRAIIDEIGEGISSAKQNKSVKILDRREAIRTAVAGARKGDVVVMTGKGSEPYIRIARGKRIPWSDRKVTEEILAELENKNED
ncbi:MAG: Mur ligase family protein, partial [Patescibacteria group bacterium]|nr:Mur ligase family protein [Patescibacteria group bacterium]